MVFYNAQTRPSPPNRTHQPTKPQSQNKTKNVRPPGRATTAPGDLVASDAVMTPECGLLPNLEPTKCKLSVMEEKLKFCQTTENNAKFF